MQILLPLLAFFLLKILEVKLLPLSYIYFTNLFIQTVPGASVFKYGRVYYCTLWLWGFGFDEGLKQSAVGIAYTRSVTWSMVCRISQRRMQTIVEMGFMLLQVQNVTRESSWSECAWRGCESIIWSRWQACQLFVALVMTAPWTCVIRLLIWLVLWGQSSFLLFFGVV